MKLMIEQLKKNFDQKEVLKDISFSFEEGRIYGLLGRNGAGKTTLFNCLNGDLIADGGRFYFLEEEKELPVTTDEIGYVLSTPAVPEFLTGREFIRFFLDINKASVTDSRSIDEWLDFIHIDMEDRDRLLKDYSHGMRNKMQMLANIMAMPKLLLLDEPLTSLDVLASEEMKEMLRHLKDGRILILSTHIMDLALDLCDEIVLLNHGVLEPVEASGEDAVTFRQKILSRLKEDRNE